MVRRFDSPVGAMRSSDEGEFVEYGAYAKLEEALRAYVEAIEEDCISFCFGGPDTSEECEQRECKWVRVLAKAREVLGR